MAPKFGTSGLRGLVSELTKPLVKEYVTAFLASCPSGGAVHVGQDLRPSSPAIADWVIAALLEAGVPAVDCGVLPTPALALDAMAAGHAAVMVTGSHIPADRNGLKFYLPSGEISKQDEARINAALGCPDPATHSTTQASQAYVARYTDSFGPCLQGLRVGVYQHSSVARDLMVEVFTALGADVRSIARSDRFIPVDTEALDPATRDLFASWFSEHDLDVLVSTDGDADRPMMVDDAQRVILGDTLGALTARYLGATTICTPVSSNTMVRDPALGFDEVTLTRIGSPFVIAAMETALQSAPSARVAGYEANGGFLLGFEAHGPAGRLAPLMTRDSLLPLIAPLAAAAQAGQRLSALVDALPARFTAADRLQGIESDKSRAFIAGLSTTPQDRTAFFADMGREEAIDETDGLRLTFEGQRIIHLRPSGNAPEFRCYAESHTQADATRMVADTLDRVNRLLG